MRRRHVAPANCDVVIVGSGPSGLSLAAVLGSAGFSVICLERRSQQARQQPRSDGRTIALSHRTAQVLTQAGVWPLLQDQICPILDIRVADQDSHIHLDFDHREVGDQPFGWIIETELFDLALQARVRQLPSVQVIYDVTLASIAQDETAARALLTDGRAFAASLIAAADGRQSLCRSLAEIPTYGWTYGQTAMVCLLHHELPHDNIAVEHFEPGGPFAVLPMTDAVKPVQGLKHRSSIVWTEATPVANALMALDGEAFTARIQAKVAGYLGRVRLAGPRFSYPLSLQHARRYIAARLVLIGDAAHSIHPIAGQGFNLGMGDIAALAEELTRAAGLGLDFGQQEVLQRFEKRRKFANGHMVLATDMLDRLFSTAAPPVQAARRFGLAVVGAHAKITAFFYANCHGRQITCCSRYCFRLSLNP